MQDNKDKTIGDILQAQRDSLPESNLGHLWDGKRTKPAPAFRRTKPPAGIKKTKTSI